MNENYIIFLINRHLSGELSEKEKGELQNWALADPDNQLLINRITSEDELEKELSLWHAVNPAEGYLRWKAGQEGRRKMVRRIVGWSVAASVIAITAVGLIIKSRKQDLPAQVIVRNDKPVAPGRNTAKLILSGGQEILLDSTSNGAFLMEGDVRIKHDKRGLSYDVVKNNNDGVVTYNTLTTPRSGQYQLSLPDGSRVWLNSESSLRYPTSFRGKERVIELTTGEAYFEIAKDPAKPFVVKLKNEDVEVLGTSFNISAYPEEKNTETTLLDGSVVVRAGRSSAQLHPNEQTQLLDDGSLRVLKNVPSQDIVCWKDGFFYFSRAPFSAVMRQLSRWYDVEVIYQGKVPEIEFEGKVDRNLPLQELLNFLDKNQVHFRIEGHNLIVLPS